MLGVYQIEAAGRVSACPSTGSQAEQVTANSCDWLGPCLWHLKAQKRKKQFLGRASICQQPRERLERGLSSTGAVAASTKGRVHPAAGFISFSETTAKFATNRLVALNGQLGATPSSGLVKTQ